MIKLLKDLGRFVYGNILGIAIFACFLLCSIAVDWLSKQFDLSATTKILVEIVVKLISISGVICAGAFICKNTINFIKVLFGK